MDKHITLIQFDKENYMILDTNSELTAEDLTGIVNDLLTSYKQIKVLSVSTEEARNIIKDSKGKIILAEKSTFEKTQPVKRSKQTLNYKINQRVKLRDDLVVDEEYGGWYFSPGGEDFIGETVTLDKWEDYEDENGRSKGFFTIREQDKNNETLYITEDMIDHEGSKYILKDGDTLSEVVHKVMNHEKYKDNKKGIRKTQKDIVHTDTAKEKPISESISNDFIQEDISDELIQEGLIQEDNIKPAHYRKGGDDFDLFEAAYRTRPFAEFRAIMEFVAERYLRRLKGSPEKRIEDLNKAIYTIQRLKEKEVIELKKINDKKEKAKKWISDRATLSGLPSHDSEIITLNNSYFNVNDDNLRLSIFNYVHSLTQDNTRRIVPENFHEFVYNHKSDANCFIRPEIYQDIVRIQNQQ